MKNKGTQTIDDRELFKKGWQIFIDTLNDVVKTNKIIRKKILEKQKMMTDGVRKTSGFNI